MKNNISMKDFYEKYTNNSEKLTIIDRLLTKRPKYQ